MAVAGADERVAIRESHGAEERVAPRLGAVAALLGLVEQRHLELPNHLARRVILAHETVGLMRDEIRAGGGLADEPRVAVGVGLVQLELHLALNLAVLVHLDDAARAGLGDHREAVLDALEGVHLDALALVAVHFAGVVFPHDLLVRRDLDDFLKALLK